MEIVVQLSGEETLEEINTALYKYGIIIESAGTLYKIPLDPNLNNIEDIISKILQVLAVTPGIRSAHSRPSFSSKGWEVSK